MTREEWRNAHRLERVEANERYKKEHPPGSGLGQRAMVRAFRALYIYEYTPKQDVIIRLFYKYRSKLPRPDQTRYLKQIHRWMPEARQRGKERMRSLVYSKNPLLDLVEKQDWSGSSFPMPIESGGGI